MYSNRKREYPNGVKGKKIRKEVFQLESLNEYDKEVLDHRTLNYMTLKQVPQDNCDSYEIIFNYRGIPPLKNRFSVQSDSKLGIDLGVSSVAIYRKGLAADYSLDPYHDKMDKLISEVNTEINLELAVANPLNYDFDEKTGKRKYKTGSGKVKNKRTKKLRKLFRRQRRLYYLKRVLRNDHQNALIRDFTNLSQDAYTEDVRAQAWKERHEKSIQNNAPGRFLSNMHKVFGYVNKDITKISTWTTAMSQYDHTDKRKHKENADQRIRQKCLSDDTEVQRDVYSAFLAIHTFKNENGTDLVGDVSDVDWERYKIDQQTMKDNNYHSLNKNDFGMTIPNFMQDMKKNKWLKN